MKRNTAKQHQPAERGVHQLLPVGHGGGDGHPARDDHRAEGVHQCLRQEPPGQVAIGELDEADEHEQRREREERPPHPVEHEGRDDT